MIDTQRPWRRPTPTAEPAYTARVSQGGEPRDDAGATRIAVVLLAATVVSAALLALAAWIGEPEAAAGRAHPAIPGMQHGGDGEARIGPVLWIGGLFGLVQIAFFGLCFALGMRRREGLGPLRRPLLTGLAAYSVLWVGFVASYTGYVADPLGTSRWLGFPLPTAILLFAFWPLPVLFVGIYLRHFDYFVDEVRVARFRERLAELQERER